MFSCLGCQTAVTSRHRRNPQAETLVATGVVVRCHVLVEEVLQFPLQRLKRGPLQFVLLPALQHDVVDDSVAAGRAGHPVALRDPLHHLVVGHGWKRNRRGSLQAGKDDFK